MKKVLLIAGNFPPVNEVSSRRPAGFAKYLGHYGWDVTVLAAWPYEGQDQMSPEDARFNGGFDESRVVRAVVPAQPQYRNRLARKWYTLQTWLSLPGGWDRVWARRVRTAADGRCSDTQVIWATAPFYEAFLAASSLSRELSVPWVADFRDIPEHLTACPTWLKRIAVWRSRQLCKGSRRLTTVSHPFARTLRARHSVPVDVIPNGFDPDWVPEGTGVPDSKVFRIAYTGGIYGPQDPMPVVHAVNELVGEGVVPEERIELSFYGSGMQRLSGAEKGKLRKRPRVEPFLCLGEVIRVQRQATVLLALGWPGERGIVPAKLFEYMAAGRPVLAYPRDPEGIDDVLRATGIGRSCDSVAELKATILQWYWEWESTGDIRLRRDLDEIGKSNRKEQAGQLASVLDQVVSELGGLS